MWAGHLCCLCGFEWSRLWAFFPGSFRPLPTLLLTLAFFAIMIFDQCAPRNRAGTILVASTWCGTVLSPLIDHPWEGLSLALIGLLLVVSHLKSRQVIFNLLWLGAVVTCVVVQAFPQWFLGTVLTLVSAVELYVLSRREPELKPLPNPEEGPPRAEIYWLGFAQVYACSASGEGEKFSSQVLKDTMKMIDDCEGCLIRGSEHRGIYTFPSTEYREQCHRVLSAYGKQMEEVLDKAQAPAVSLVFKAEN